MRVTWLRAAIVLHRTFSSYPVSVRAHILGRFLTCPFTRTLAHVPAGGRVLDIGAGHGTFARLAVEAGAREVVAVEPDLRKVLGAFRHPEIRFVAGFDASIRGTFDLVTMFDVLYRVPLPEWDALFATIHERLSPGGTFLIKELDPSNGIKFAWNRAQELVSDRFLGITLGSEFSYEPRERIQQRLEAAGFVQFAAEPIDAGYPHSHITYLARKR